MSRSSGLFGGLLVLALVSVNAAQPPGQPPRGPGGGMRFGFGNQGAAGLLALPEVRKELATSDSQNKQLDEVVNEFQEQSRAAFAGFDFRALQELSEEERQKKIAEMRTKSEEATKKAEGSIAKILDAKQNTRLAQLRIQRDGIGAFQQADIVKALKLSEEQLDKMRQIQQGVFAPFIGPQEMQKALTDSIALLTAEQKTKWETLVGKAFTFPQPGFGGPGGFGGMGGQQRKLLAQFDKNKDGWLNNEERKAAREFIKKQPQGGGRGPGGGGFGPGGGRGPGGGFGPPPQPGQLLPAPVQDELKLTEEQKKKLEAIQKLVDAGLEKILTEDQRKALKDMQRGPGGFGPPGGGGFGPGGFGRDNPTPKPGPKVAVADVKSYPDAKLYDGTVLRTLFLEFENKDWEDELADFKGSDVEVPVTMTVDGKKYKNVGVHFRGMSSYGMVRAGSKRSFNLSMDLDNKKQRLYGYKTLNLLNAHDDPSFLNSVLYSHIARQYIPAPKANLVKVVVNGESWGVYVNVQQFNKEFTEEAFKSSKGTRWKVRGNPGGQAGLDYVGDKIDDYKRRYEMKSKEDDKAWKALVELCRTLSKTAPDKLEEALKPMLDVEGALWFLALDVALINGDGYWTRASDYSIYRDPKGIFHIVPSDMNEAFQPSMGFGMGGPGGGGRPGGGGGRPGGGGPGGGMRGIELDPLVNIDNNRMALRKSLLAVPKFKARYLEMTRTIADKSLDWKTLGPVVAKYRELIEKEIEIDTRKLDSFEAFKAATSDTAAGEAPPMGRRPRMSLRNFADQRRAFLLKYTDQRKSEK